MNDYWRDLVSKLILMVVGAVVGGLLLWISQVYLEKPLTPAPNLAWAVHGEENLPLPPEKFDGARIQYEVLFENMGGATARNVEVFFADKPTFVMVPNGNIFSWKQEGEFWVLYFDAIAAGGRVPIRAYSEAGAGPVAVRVNGEPIAAAQLHSAGFGKRAEPLNTAIATLMILVLLGMAWVTYREFFPSKQKREELKEQKEAVRQLLQRFETNLDAPRALGEQKDEQV